MIDHEATPAANDDRLSSDGGLIQYARAVYRRRWIALTTFVLVVTYAALQTFTAMPVYEATSQLIIKANDERNVLTFEDVVKNDRAAFDYAETQYRLLRSRALARRTAGRATTGEAGPTRSLIACTRRSTAPWIPRAPASSWCGQCSSWATSSRPSRSTTATR